MPARIDEAGIEAEMVAGVLKVLVPKAPESQVKKIEIKGFWTGVPFCGHRTNSEMFTLTLRIKNPFQLDAAALSHRHPFYPLSMQENSSETVQIENCIVAARHVDGRRIDLPQIAVEIFAPGFDFLSTNLESRY